MSLTKRSRPAKSTVSAQSRFANVNGTRRQYLIAGAGDPVILLHDYAETGHMWRPLIAKLAGASTVIAPDLRGAGESSTPVGGTPKLRWHAICMPWRVNLDSSTFA